MRPTFLKSDFIAKSYWKPYTLFSGCALSLVPQDTLWRFPKE